MKVRYYIYFSSVPSKSKALISGTASGRDGYTEEFDTKLKSKYLNNVARKAIKAKNMVYKLRKKKFSTEDLKSENDKNYL